MRFGSMMGRCGDRSAGRWTGYTKTMDAWQATRYGTGLVIGLVILTVLTVTFYTRQRYNAAHTLENSSVVALLSTRRDIPPTKCVLWRSDFNDAYKAYVYFDGKARRIDSVALVERAPTVFHTVTPDGQTAYVWKDGDVYSRQIPVSQIGASLEDVLLKEITCEPIWFPEEKTFNTPPPDA